MARPHHGHLGFDGDSLWFRRHAPGPAGRENPVLLAPIPAGRGGSWFLPRCRGLSVPLVPCGGPVPSQSLVHGRPAARRSARSAHLPLDFGKYPLGRVGRMALGVHFGGSAAGLPRFHHPVVPDRQAAGRPLASGRREVLAGERIGKGGAGPRRIRADRNHGRLAPAADGPDGAILLPDRHRKPGDPVLPALHHGRNEGDFDYLAYRGLDPALCMQRVRDPPERILGP